MFSHMNSVHVRQQHLVDAGRVVDDAEVSVTIGRDLEPGSDSDDSSDAEDSVARSQEAQQPPPLTKKQ